MDCYRVGILMVQRTFHCNGDLLPNYPGDDLPVQDVHVYIHDSLMVMNHDYSCPVCRKYHAILSGGIFQPCRNCQKDGYKMIKDNGKSSKFLKILGIIK